jgi:hypothetical protein
MTFDPLAPELPPQNELEELIDADCPPYDLAVALLDVHLGMPGREDEQGAFSPEVREFADGPAMLAFSHPGRLDRWLAVAERPPGRMVAHAAPGRALFEQLVATRLPLALNAANGNHRFVSVADMEAALAAPGMS